MNVSNILLTYFDLYQPITRFTITQPIYSTFIPNSAQIYINAISQTDIKMKIPSSSSAIYKITVMIKDTKAAIITR